MKKFTLIIFLGATLVQFALACPTVPATSAKPVALAAAPAKAEAKVAPVPAKAPAPAAKPVVAKANAPAKAKAPAPVKAKPAPAKPAPAKPSAPAVAAKPAVTAAAEMAQKDPRAEKTLNEMSKKYQAMKAYSASFSQTLENPNSKVKETMKGDITVMGNKFRLSMDGHEVINNGTTIWTFMKNENEVNISDYDPADEEITPNQIYNMYQKGYKFNFLREEKQGGQVYEIIELTPEDRSNPVFKVELTIHQKDKTLKSWKMFRNNGNRYTYDITNFVPNPPVAASDFTFDKAKYKGVKVIDLR
jgi:outer membrane lipoprotein carrier protein